MNNKKPQLLLLAFLALVLASATIASVIAFHRSKSAVKTGAKTVRTATAGKSLSVPIPSLGQKEDAGQDQERSGDIAEVRQIRLHPTPAKMKALVALINTNKDTTVLSEALNTLGVLAQSGIDFEQTCRLLAQKALDKDFPSRGEALLIDAMLAKNKALPAVSAFLQGGGASAGMLAWASRALSMIATPESIPVIEKLLSQTTDPDVRGASFAALAKAGTPEAFSLLEQQTQTTTGKNQAYSVAALSESKDPQIRQWIVGAIQNGTLSKDALSALAMMPAAPDILGQALAGGALSPAKQLELLKQIAPGLRGNANRQKLALALAPLVYAGDVKVQEETIKLVAQSGGRKVADIIKPFLSSENPELRKDAFFSYMQFTSADNYKYLYDFLGDKNPETRRMAIFMIGRYYGASDRSALEQAAQSSDEFIRDKARQYLSSLN